MKTHNLFISHSWAYSDAYNGLINLLKERPYFSFKNYSVPLNDPIHTKGTDTQLYDAIRSQISPCHVVIVLAGVYSSYSKWINKEIEIANLYKKPIIAVKPWASTNTSAIVKANAVEIVGWNTESIVEAIRKHS